MQKLGALDANFLYTETELTPNHIASVQRFELPEGVSSSEYIDGLKGYFMERLHLVPYLHRKLKFVPGNLDHPLWVEARDFNIDRHIVEIPLEAPATMADVETKIAELHAVNMDKRRPLWTLYVLTGMEDGSVVYYNQVHHAAIDGMAGQAATMIMMDNTPDHPPVSPAGPEVSDDEGMASLLQLSFENLFKYQMGTASRMLGVAESMRRIMQRAMDPSREFGAMGRQAPRTRFNQTIGKARSYAVGEFPLAEIRAMGKQLGCTVNDVFMAICSGGLRRYLTRHNELPDTGLIAGCPVSLRRAHDRDMGNQVSMMNVDLATHIDDPKLRLLAVHESARIAKEVLADISEGYDPDVSLPGLPAMLSMAAAAAERTQAANRMPMPVNLVISNVPGPREELFSNGARMLTHYPVSIPAHGVGLNITVQSYMTRLYFGVTACAKALPDADVMRDDLLAAFVELRQLLLPNNVSTFKAAAQPAAASREHAAESVATKVA